MQKQELHLRPIRTEDESLMLDILTSDIVKTTYILPDFDCREEALPLFHKLITLSNDETRYVRGICRGTQLIGFLNDVEIKNGMIELRYVIHPDFHGQGYMTQALVSAIAELFSAGYREIVAGAFEQNTASIRVMEKAGMTKLYRTDEIEYRSRIHRCVYYHTVLS